MVKMVRKAMKVAGLSEGWRGMSVMCVWKCGKVREDLDDSCVMRWADWDPLNNSYKIVHSFKNHEKN